MLISSASPQELVDWFHTRQEQQRLLCVLLAPSDADQQKLASLIANLDEADTALGRKVAFLLLDPTTNNALGIDQPRGEVAAFPGYAFPSSQHPEKFIRPLRNEQTFQDLGHDWEELRGRIARNSSKATAQFVPEFAELFAISPAEQPCLCVLVKGLDQSVVLPLGDDWSEATLIALMTQLHNIADQTPNFRAAYQHLEADGPQSLLPPLEKAVEEINEHISTLTQVLERILVRHDGTASDIEIMAGFVADRCPGTARLQLAFSQMSFSSAPDLKNDRDLLRATKLMTKISTIRNKINNDRKRKDIVVSLADQAQLVVESRAQLFDSLNKLQPLRLVSTSTVNGHLLSKLKSNLEWIDLVGNAHEKVASAVYWCMKLLSK
ncbi:hypothetical protein DMX09_15585 [Pseudomonas protegens]|uniref:hypothetical protein n=1 Tax=Pseudomonas protegens TaxID=380021 RepID=UPI000D95222D|nr:hypothetical protein [Pseudomonas protegens]PYC03572.1 hypothetical protein DMX09_15585 [Pseudomonas protegens]